MTKEKFFELLEPNFFTKIKDYGIEIIIKYSYFKYFDYNYCEICFDSHDRQDFTDWLRDLEKKEDIEGLEIKKITFEKNHRKFELRPLGYGDDKWEYKRNGEVIPDMTDPPESASQVIKIIRMKGVKKCIKRIV